MSNFPSIEEFDGGQIHATKLEDGDDSGDLLDSAQDDFLAREQAVLGDDAEFFQSARNTSSSPSQGQAAFFGGEQDEDVHEFESSFPALETTTNGFGHASTVTQPSVPKDEPEVIKQWRAERDLQIQRREEISQKKKQETIDQAKQAIDDFYDNYNNQKEKAVAQTRKEEEEYLASRDENGGGTAWERMSNYVDISEKSAAGSGPTRYRELLLSLKNDSNAPGAEA